MFAEERKEKIMELLRQNKRTSIGELTEMFQVSGTTIRTYLTELEKAGKLVRTHGGAMLNEDVLDMEESISARKDKRMEEKQKIAKTARAMIEDGDMILLDSGTTTLELAKLLKDANNLTVVTNDLQIALELQRHQGIYLIFLGGHVRNYFECTVGNMGLKFLENLSADKAFMSANALSLAKGATTPNLEQAEIKKGMMGIAEWKYLICDSSKIGKRTICSYAKAEEFHRLITDAQIPDHAKEVLEKQGIEVVCS